MGEPLDKNTDEKETCLITLKGFLENKILKYEDYKYLQDKAFDFYDIILPIFPKRSDVEILRECWGK
jgi:hypothetical protein